jgi:hypothetical protein
MLRYSPDYNLSAKIGTFERRCGTVGDTKIIFGTSDGTILKKFKFPSTIAITQKSEYVTDSRIYDFKGHSYYVGESALNSPSENMIDITDYKNLEYYAPLFLVHALKQLDGKPDVIVTGLSKAQIQFSGNFKQNLQSFEVNETPYKFDTIFVLPQGAGSKLTIDKYGDNFPNEQSEFSGKTTFVGVDIGFNTLDMFMVTDGKTSPTLFEGIENEGVMKIAKLVAKKVYDEHGRQITLHEAKEILGTNLYKLRGKTHDFTEFNKEIKTKYLRELLQLIENRYGKVIDKCDFIHLSGGGSTIFKSTEDNFIKVPKNSAEYMNSIGFYLFGIGKV